MAISIDAVVGQRAIDTARARGEVDIPGVTSLEGTPVDPLGHLQDATILGGMPFNETLLAQLARTDPELVRDIMRSRTYMSGEGLLGQATGDPFLQTISMQNDGSGTLNLGQLMGETYDEFLDRDAPLETPTTVAKTLEDLSKFLSEEDEEGDVNKALANANKVTSAVNEKIYDEILPETPPGTTDIFNAKTGMWEAVYDRPSETSFVDTQVTDIGDDILSGTQSFEVETPLGTTDIFDTETGEWTGLTDTQKAPFAGYPNQQGIGSDSPISPNTPDWAIERWWEDIERRADLNDLINQEEKTTATPTIQDTQANVMDEGILAGLGMTADQSHALTRELNTLGRERYPHEIEALKRGAVINRQTEQNLEEEQLQFYHAMRTDEEESLTGYLEGLSQAMKNVLENDPELMAQYMAARSSIIAQLEKTGYKEHEEFYPGSQAAATQAGFWGPMALGWNDSYNDYKDAQRELMGLQSGQRFWSEDWINNLGWMSPEQINRISGYGEP